MITPYLNFQGNCEQAFNFYSKVFGGTISYLGRFSEMPPEIPVPEGYADKVMHISLDRDGKSFLMGSDAPDGFGPPFNAGNNVQLSLDAESPEEARRLYDVLREGGQVGMELEPTFWAKLFAMVTDKYGINWMISFGEPEQG